MCVCHKRRKNLCTQLMGQLPIEAIKLSPPFSSIGIYFLGLYSIRGKVQKGFWGKCYGVIFSCIVSRAAYIDVSENKSGDSLL